MTDLEIIRGIIDHNKTCLLGNELCLQCGHPTQWHNNDPVNSCPPGRFYVAGRLAPYRLKDFEAFKLREEVLSCQRNEQGQVGSN